MSSSSVYSAEFRDLRTNSLVREAQVDRLKFGGALNDSAPFSCSLAVAGLGTDKHTAFEITTPAFMCVYFRRDATYVYGGIIWTSKYDSSTGTIDIAGADWWSYFDHRKILPVLPADPDVNLVAGLSFSATGAEQNELARQLVTLAQSHTAGDIGIQLDSSTSNILRDRTYTGYQLKGVGEALRDLSSVIDGPDIQFDVAPPGADGKPVRRMLLGTPSLTQDGDPWLFELGGNVSAYRWPRDGSRMATRFFAPGDGIERDMPIAVAEDTTYTSLGWPLLEADQTYSSVTNPSTLQSHADADQMISRLPVALPELDVRGEADPILGTWRPGHYARLVINDDLFGRNTDATPRGLDTIARIVAFDATPDTRGEAVTVTLSPLLDDVA